MFVCVTNFVRQSCPNSQGDSCQTRREWQLGGGVGSLMQFWDVQGQGGQRSPGLTTGPNTKVCWNEVVAGSRLGGYGHASQGPTKMTFPGGPPEGKAQKNKVVGHLRPKCIKKRFQIGQAVPKIWALQIYNIGVDKILACPFS